MRFTTLLVILTVSVGFIAANETGFLLKKHNNILVAHERTLLLIDEQFNLIADHLDLKECLQGKLKGCVDGFKESISKLSKEDQQKQAAGLLGELKNFLDYLKNSKPASVDDIEKWLNTQGYNTKDNKVFWNCVIASFKSCAAGLFDLFDQTISQLSIEHDDLKECLQGKLKGCVDGFKESISQLSKDDQQKQALALLGELKNFLDYLKNSKPGSVADIEKWINGQGYDTKDNKVFWNCVIASFKSCSAAGFYELHNTISMITAEHNDLKECLQGKLKGCVDGFKEGISKLSKDEQQQKAGVLLGELKAFLEYLKTSKPESVADIEKWINGKGFNNKDNKVFWTCVISSFKSCAGGLLDLSEFEYTVSMISAEHTDLKECLQGKLKGCVDGFKESISKLSKADQQQKAGALLGELKNFLDYLKTSKPASIADIEKWINGKGYNTADNKEFWNCTITAFQSCTA